jgi:hypothetical protein
MTLGGLIIFVTTCPLVLVELDEEEEARGQPQLLLPSLLIFATTCPLVLVELDEEEEPLLMPSLFLALLSALTRTQIAVHGVVELDEEGEARCQPLDRFTCLI